MHHLCIAVSMGRGKKERKCENTFTFELCEWRQRRYSNVHHWATLYDSTYRSLGKNTSPNTWKKWCSKNLSKDEGSEGKRKARIRTEFKVTKSSGVSLHSQRRFLSSLQVTLHHWEQSHTADSLLWSSVRHQAFALDNSKSQVDLYKELSAHNLIHLVFLPFSPSTTCQEAGCKNLGLL